MDESKTTRPPQIPGLVPLLKSNFISGLFVLIPFGVIIWILMAALRTLWGLHQVLPASWQPENFLHDANAARLLNVGITLGLAFVFALGVSVLGWASKHYLGKKVLEVIAHLIERIPVIRSVYSALDQLLKTLATGKGQQFNRVVYVEYPRKGVWTIAFVTGPARGPMAPEKHLNIYVPTTPNPTSGFHLIVPENDVRESNLKVEDAFKTILSLGIAQTDRS